MRNSFTPDSVVRAAELARQDIVVDSAGDGIVTSAVFDIETGRRSEPDTWRHILGAGDGLTYFRSSTPNATDVYLRLKDLQSKGHRHVRVGRNEAGIYTQPVKSTTAGSR